MDYIWISPGQMQMNAFSLNFETFHNLDVDPADMIRTITDKADAIRTHYG